MRRMQRNAKILIRRVAIKRLWWQYTETGVDQQGVFPSEVSFVNPHVEDGTLEGKDKFFESMNKFLELWKPSVEESRMLESIADLERSLETGNVKELGPPMITLRDVAEEFNEREAAEFLDTCIETCMDYSSGRFYEQLIKFYVNAEKYEEAGDIFRQAYVRGKTVREETRRIYMLALAKKGFFKLLRDNLDCLLDKDEEQQSEQNNIMLQSMLNAGYMDEAMDYIGTMDRSQVNSETFYVMLSHIKDLPTAIELDKKRTEMKIAPNERYLIALMLLLNEHSSLEMFHKIIARSKKFSPTVGPRFLMIAAFKARMLNDGKLAHELLFKAADRLCLYHKSIDMKQMTYQFYLAAIERHILKFDSPETQIPLLIRSLREDRGTYDTFISTLQDLLSEKLTPKHAQAKFIADLRKMRTDVVKAAKAKKTNVKSTTNKNSSKIQPKQKQISFQVAT